jgi:ferredoxin
MAECAHADNMRRPFGYQPGRGREIWASRALSASQRVPEHPLVSVDHEGMVVREGGCPARAPGAGRRLVVDWSRCEGHGLCELLAPELVTVDIDGYPQLAEGPVPPWLAGKAARAITHCPSLALRFAE